MERNCGNCANAENCSKFFWMKCKSLESWVPVLDKSSQQKSNVETTKKSKLKLL